MIEPTEPMPTVPGVSLLPVLPAETVNTILTALMSAEGALDLVSKDQHRNLRPRPCAGAGGAQRFCGFARLTACSVQRLGRSHTAGFARRLTAILEISEGLR